MIKRVFSHFFYTELQDDITNEDLKIELSYRHVAQLLIDSRLGLSHHVESIDESIATANEDISMDQSILDPSTNEYFDDDDSMLLSSSTIASKLTSDPEAAYVDVVWVDGAEFIKAKGKGHATVPRTRKGTGNLYKHQSFDVYNHRVRPTSSDPSGIWVTTSERPYQGILHFAHEFMQKQNNLMAEPFASQIWKCFPTQKPMSACIPKKLETEADKMSLFAKNIKIVTNIEYTSDERQDLLE